MELADVFRYALTGKEQFVKLGEELAVVEAYLNIERLRMGKRLKVKIEASDEARGVLIPALTIQPLVENAVKHGVNARAEGGTVRVVARLAEKRLQVSVADDGPGFGAAPAEDSGHGLSNVRRRVRLCYGGHAQLDIESSSQGATVRLEVPLAAAKPARRLAG